MVEVTLPSGVVAKLKDKPTFGDDEDAQDYAFKESRLNAYYQWATVSQIIEWDAKDAAGNVLPLTVGGLKQLDIADGRLLEETVRPRFKLERSSAGEDPLANDSSTSSTAETTAEPPSPS